MLSSKEVKDLLMDTHPEDGFRVLDVIVADRHALYVVLRTDGVRVDLPGRELEAYLMWGQTAPTPEQLGDKARTKLLIDAMCRYVNTGGTTADLCGWGERLKYACNGAVMTMPGGFKLIDSILNTEGNHEHLFQSEQSNQIIRWTEQQFFDVFPRVELQREVAENDATELAQQDAASPPASAGHSPYLLDPESDGDAGRNQEGDSGDVSRQTPAGS